MYKHAELKHIHFPNEFSFSIGEETVDGVSVVLLPCHQFSPALLTSESYNNLFYSFPKSYQICKWLFNSSGDNELLGLRYIIVDKVT